MVFDIHMSADQRNRGLKHVPVKGDGPVFCHLAPGGFAEMIFQVCRCGANAFHGRGKSFKRGFACGTVVALVIFTMKPLLKRLIQIFQGFTCKSLQELKPDSSEPALYLTFSLGFIRPCMDQSDGAVFISPLVRKKRYTLDGLYVRQVIF